MGEPHCWSHACDYLNTIKISADKNVQDHFTPTPAGKSLPRISVDSRLRRRVGGVVCTLHTWSPQLKKGLKQPIIQHSKPSNLWQKIDSQLIPVHAHSFNLQSNRCKPTPVIIPLSIQTLVWTRVWCIWFESTPHLHSLVHLWQFHYYIVLHWWFFHRWFSQSLLSQWLFQEF